jgi:hypothetical protein
VPYEWLTEESVCLTFQELCHTSVRFHQEASNASGAAMSPEEEKTYFTIFVFV